MEAVITTSLEGNVIKVSINHDDRKSSMVITNESFSDWDVTYNTILSFLSGMKVKCVDIDRFQSTKLKNVLENNGFCVRYIPIK